MAERTPRFYWNNRILRQAGVVTAVSSEQPAHSRGRLFDPSPGVSWRSKVGWNVIAGVNDKIDLNRGAGGPGDYTITIPAGNYPTPQGLAAQIQTLLQTGDPSGNMACDYNIGAPNTFRIRSTTGLTFSLEWATGPNTKKTLGRDLGYSTVADQTGANAYTAPTAAYKSREFVIFDFGSEPGDGKLAPRSAFVFGHNIPNGASVLVNGNSSAVFEDQVFATQGILIGDELLRYALADNGGTPPSGNFRYWQLAINDVAFQTAGYTEVGLFSLLEEDGAFQPGRGIAQGYERSDIHISSYETSLGGAVFQTEGPRRVRFRATFSRETRADRVLFETMAEAVKIGGHLIFMADPLNYPTQETIYCVFSAGLSYPQRVGDGTPPERFTVNVDLEEAL